MTSGNEKHVCYFFLRINILSGILDSAKEYINKLKD